MALPINSGADGRIVVAGAKVPTLNGGWISDVETTPQSSPLVETSKLLLNFPDTTRTFGYTTATSSYSREYQRFDNYTLKLDLSGNAAQIRAGTAAIAIPEGQRLLSIDIYIPFKVTSHPLGHVINVTMSNANSWDSNNVVFGFDSNYLRQGWNTLKMWFDDTDGSSGTGTLAYGNTKVTSGTGVDLTQNIGYVEILFQNMSGKSVYLDSLRTGAKAKPCIVMGFDAVSASVDDDIMCSTVAPFLTANGIKGYFTMTYIYDLLYIYGVGGPRRNTLYNDHLWDVLPHTWNHGGTTPGMDATVTLTRASNVVTATFSAVHGFPIGSRRHMAFSGATPADMNGIFETTATTPTKVTYPATGADGAGTGTISVSTTIASICGEASTLTTEILTREIADIVKAQRSCGFYRGSSIGVWPNNSSGDLNTVRSICKDSNVSAFRGIRGGTVKINEFGIDNPYHFGSVELGSGASATTTQYVKDKISGAIGRGEHIWLYGHYVLDETDPVNIAHVAADLNYPPGSGGNPAPPAAGVSGTGGGWWYMGQIKKLVNETIIPLVSSGELDVKSPTEWAKSLGMRA